MNKNAADPLMERFDGRMVVVTGAGRAGQVGEAVAREFARRGASVALIDRDAAAVEELASALRRESFDINAYACDLTDAAATAAVAHRIEGNGPGRAYALANVAGGFAMSGPIADSDPALFQHQLAINLGSAYGATRAFLPAVRASRGAVVFMASAAILPGGRTEGMSAYAAAKGGVVALMRCVAQEERVHGVRANAVAPTAVRTSANLASMGHAFPYVERETVAVMIAFLCSRAAENVSGQVVELA